MWLSSKLNAQSYTKTSWVYLRSVGCIALIAHLSLWFQAMGLFGSKGILPYVERAERIRTYGLQEQWTSWDYWRAARSLLFWNPSDQAIHLCFALGCLAALGVILNRFTRPMLVLTWLTYFSISSAGNVFLSFQWDMLLLEMLVMGVLITPWQKTNEKAAPPVSFLVITAHRFLFFKLMFLSGAVKLLSQDPTWLDLSALHFHYWTQPIPHALSYFVHGFPNWVQKLSCVLMFCIELIVPFCIFGPRLLRKWAFIIQVGLQIAIIFTGNYGFFNLLTICAAIFILDDSLLPQSWFPKSPNIVHHSTSYKSLLSGVLAIIIIVIHVGIIQIRIVPETKYLSWLSAPAKAVHHLNLFHSYGLFANMTETRPEILIEGSVDKKTWKLYRFSHKPDTTSDIPGFIVPYMPRLDWQMWFAALRNNCTQTPNNWYLNFTKRLLQNEPAVLSLLEKNPFPITPPNYIRSTIAHFEFDHSNDERWWRIQNTRAYCPVLFLENGSLSAAQEIK